MDWKGIAGGDASAWQQLSLRLKAWAHRRGARWGWPPDVARDLEQQVALRFLCWMRKGRKIDLDRLEGRYVLALKQGLDDIMRLRIRLRQTFPARAKDDVGQVNKLKAREAVEHLEERLPYLEFQALRLVYLDGLAHRAAAHRLLGSDQARSLRAFRDILRAARRHAQCLLK